MLNKMLDQINQFAHLAVVANKNDALLMNTLDSLQFKLVPRFDMNGTSEQNNVANEAQALTLAVKAQVQHWYQEWSERAPMRQISQNYNDRFVLLVFGKVNAGKSSFINYLSSFFADKLNVEPVFFKVSAGEVCRIHGPLQEGATETTNVIQGVELGKHFVILDTPGLHSVTPENAKLTHRFTDAADAVVWLTPSTNPGLVHELVELKKEIELGKPVLPVISRSDTTCEYWNEPTGELITEWIPKTENNRRDQEQDVYYRAKCLMADRYPQLLQPVSLSVYCANAKHDTGSGFSSFFAAMTPLIIQAAQYKSEKWKIQQTSFLQHSVKHQLLHELKPKLSSLRQQITQQQRELDTCCIRLIDKVSAQLVSQWPELVLKFSNKKDTKGLHEAYKQCCQQALKTELVPVLKSFIERYPEPHSLLDICAIGSYKEQLHKYNIPVGAGKKAGYRVAGSLIGGMLGMLLGPAGALVGGVAGNWVAGQYFGSEEYKEETISLGIDNSSVLSHGAEVIEQDVSQITTNIFSDLTARYLTPVYEYLNQAERAIDEFIHHAD
jgi:predicted GTPase